MARGRRRERGLIRSVSFENKAARAASAAAAKKAEVAAEAAAAKEARFQRVATNDSFEVLGPIPARRAVSGWGLRRRHTVTYRQASWPRVRPTVIQTVLSEESSIEDVLSHDDSTISTKISANISNKKAIQLNSSPKGGYVSKPDSFCHVFEMDYICEANKQLEPASPKLVFYSEQVDGAPDPTAKPKLVFSSEQVDAETTGGCNGLSLFYKFIEDSLDRLYSYPGIPPIGTVQSAEAIVVFPETNASLSSGGMEETKKEVVAEYKEEYSVEDTKQFKKERQQLLATRSWRSSRRCEV